MKYSTFIALTATVFATVSATVNDYPDAPAAEIEMPMAIEDYPAYVAPNPNKIIDGAAFEAFQKDALQAGRDVAKLIDEEVVPNYNQWFNEQGANEEKFMDQAEQFHQNTHATWRQFEQRVEAGNYDQKLEAISNDLDKALWDLENNARQNGYYDKRNIASENVKLWSVGMTASKTQAVNAKMMEVAKSAMAFADDSVYGPWVEKHQQILIMDIDQALNNYSRTMELKYNSDPRFKAMSDKHMANAEALGDELDNENGWTFEDNNGSLEAAANQWNTMGLWSIECLDSNCLQCDDMSICDVCADGWYNHEGVCIIQFERSDGRAPTFGTNHSYVVSDGFNYLWTQKEYSLPLKINFTVIFTMTTTSMGWIYPAFSQNKKENGVRGADALTWSLQTYITPGPFETEFWTNTPTITYSNPFALAAYVPHEVSTEIYNDHARYYVNGTLYAECVKDGQEYFVAEKGYFGFVYGWESEISGVSIESL